LSYAQDNSLLIHKKWYFCDTNFYVGVDTNVYSSILMNLNSDYCSKIDTYNKGYIEFFENNFFEIKNEIPCSPPEISIEGGVKSIFVSLCSSVYQGRFQFISDWNIQLDNYIYSIDILDEDNLVIAFCWGG
jgi:hypothetical protein